MAANAVVLTWDLIARDDASRAFERVGAAASGASEGGLAAFAKSAAKTGLALGVFATVVGVAAVKAATKFQQSMLLIQTQAGASADEVKKMSSAALTLAGQVGTAPDQLATSMYHAYSVTKNMAQALDITKIAAEGAKVGHADLEETTNALTSTVASGIPGVQNMAQAMGKLNSIVGAGDMKLSDLNDALGSGVLTIVKGYGLSIDDVGAALATFGDNNIRGADAATMLRMAVQAMAVPAKTAGAVFDKLGLSTTQLKTDMQTGGLNKAILDLHDHMQAAGVTADQVGGLITEAFGKKAGPGVAVLLGQVGRFETKLADVKKGGQAFGDEWQATTHTVAFEWDALKAKLDAFVIRLGTALLPVASRVLGALSGMMDHLNNASSEFFNGLSGNVKQMDFSSRPKIEKFGLAIHDLVLGMEGTRLNSNNSVVKAVNGIGVAVHNALSDVKGWAQTAGSVAGILMTDVSYGIKTGNWSLVGDEVSYAISGAMKTAKNVGSKIEDTISSWFLQVNWTNAGTMMANLLTGAMSVVTGVGARLESAFTGWMRQINFGRIGGALTDLLNSAFKAVHWSDMGSTVADAITRVFTGTVVVVSAITKAILKLFGSIDWLTLGKDAATAAVPFIVGFVNNIINSLLSFAVHHPMDMVLFAAAIFPIGKAAGALEKVVAKFPLLDKFVGPFLRLLSKGGELVGKGASKIFGPIGRGIADGFKAIVPDAGKGLGYLWTWIRVRILEIGDDIAKWFNGIGSKAGRSLGTGLGEAYGFIRTKLQELISFILRPFADAGSWLVGKGGEIIDGLGRGISAAWGGIKSWFLGMPGRIWSEIGDATQWLYNLGKQLVQGIINGIADAPNILSSLLDKIPGGSTAKSLVGKVAGGVASGAKAVVTLGGIIHFASGTNYAPGGWAMVGENGPEMAYIPQGSKVIPNNKTRDMLGGGDTYISVTIPGTVIGGDAARLADDIANHLEVAVNQRGRKLNISKGIR